MHKPHLARDSFTSPWLNATLNSPPPLPLLSSDSHITPPTLRMSASKHQKATASSSNSSRKGRARSDMLQAGKGKGEDRGRVCVEGTRKEHSHKECGVILH